MAVLIIAEQDGKQLKPGFTNTVTAASKIGGDITVLVAGKEGAQAAQAAAKVAGVKNVLLAELELRFEPVEGLLEALRKSS